MRDSETRAVFSYPIVETQSREFRLLKVLPARLAVEPLECELFTASLDRERGKYVAASYTWGPPTPTTPIFLNGARFDIRSNLADFLRVYRSDNETLVLWCDAICIQQSNLAERTHQVSLMATIYNGASSVAVWLGPCNEELSLAIDIMLKIGSDKTCHLDPSQGPAAFKNDGNLNAQSFPIAAFFSLPWWYRVWTVQEYALARRRVFYCGHRIIEGSMIDAFKKNTERHHSSCCRRLMLCYHRSDLPTTLQDSLGQLTVLGQYEKKVPTKFLQTLNHFDMRKATDPRDKIYGLMGILTHSGPPILDAYYDLTPQQVCASLCKRWIERDRNLDFLEHLSDYAGFSSQTYVPDWTGKRLDQQDCWDSDRKLVNFDVYSASGQEEADLYVHDDGTAQSSGIFVDSIESLTTAPWTAYSETVQQSQELIKSPGAGKRYSNKPEPVFEAFLQTMPAGLQYGAWYTRHDPNPDKDEYRRHLDVWHRIIQKGWGNTHVFNTQAAPETSRAFNAVHACFRSTIYGRKFALTKSGWFGWVPQASREGDDIVVLFGSRSPCILRRVDGGKLYNVLGTAYIHGIMQGECMVATADGPGISQIVMV